MKLTKITVSVRAGAVYSIHMEIGRGAQLDHYQKNGRILIIHALAYIFYTHISRHRYGQRGHHCGVCAATAENDRGGPMITRLLAWS
jgi:hypothetical protein